MAQAQNQRIAGLVNQLVDPAGLEPARQVDVGVGLNDRVLGTLKVEADAGLDARELPGLRRDLDALVVGVAAPRQPRLRCIARDRRVAAGGDPATQGQRGLAFLGNDELGPHRAGERRGTVGRDGQVHRHAAVARQQVSLPGAPHHRVAAAEQVAVAGVLQRRRVVAGRRVAKVLHRPLVAAVAVVEEEPPVSACRIGRLQDAEVGGELDQAVPIARRLVQIDDPRLRGRVGIDGEARPPGQPLVGAGVAELVAAGEGAAFVDVDGDPVAQSMLPAVASPIHYRCGRRWRRSGASRAAPASR